MLDEQPTESTTTDTVPDSGTGDTSQAATPPPPRKRAPRKTAAKKTAPAEEAAPQSAPDGDVADSQPAKKTTAKKTAAKKTAAKKTTAKKTAAKKTTAKKATASDDAPAEGEAAGAQNGKAAPAAVPLFQPPDPVAAAPRKRAAKKTAPAPQDGAEQPAAERADRTDDRADDQSGDQSDDQSGDGEGGEGAARRRRRRGGRRRRKPAGEGAGDGSGDDQDDSGEADSSSSSGGDSDSGDGEGESASSRRRRRRRRAGDGDDQEGDDPENTVTRVRKPRSAEDEITGFSGSTRLEAKKQRRREGREAGRRRAPIISEAEFLARREAVDRTMVVRQRGDLTQIAVLEDKVLVEHYVARESQTSLIGNVYLGKVQNVLPSMEAAFIDIGRGRNAVLYAGEVNWDALGAKNGGQRKIEQVLKSGQSVLVQVTKDPIGHKGARLTSQISLPGRFLVYVPGGNTSGISRKLPDNERNRLKNLLKEIVPDTAGVIVRTAAEGASESELTRDVERLKSLWEDISGKVDDGASAPQVLYAEPDLTLKVVRDLFTEDIAQLVVSGQDAWDMVQDYVEHVAPDLADRLEKHDDSERDAFADHRIDEQISKALDRKVWLPSGGSLVIDRTEAMTVVDVNTGKFTGSGGNLEETVTKNNLEAAEEIVRQLRLRDIGGIIVVDFIDMVLESNRDLVLRRLIECLGRDRTRHQVAEVTSLGLVQMTRKRIGTGLLEAFSETCEHCQGRGLHVHHEPVEPKKKQSDDEPRRARRNRGRKDDNGGGAKSGDSSGSKGADKAAGGNGTGRRPTPAEFAAMARADQAAADAEAEAEAEAGTAADSAAESDSAVETEAETQSAVDSASSSVPEPVTDAEPVVEAEPPSPDAEPVPTGPRIVTSVRRVGARRPAGPPAAPVEQAAPVDQPAPVDQAVPDQAAVEVAPGGGGAEATELAEDHVHVPIKKKGSRKR